MNNAFENLGVTIFFRDGKYHWMVKSCAFSTPEQALRDALKVLDVGSEGVVVRRKENGVAAEEPGSRDGSTEPLPGVRV